MAVLSNLMVRIGVDPGGVRRGVDRARNELGRMGTYAARLSRAMGRSGEDGGREFGEGFYRDASGRLRDSHGRFVATGAGLGGAVGGGFIKGFGRSLGRLMGAASGLFRATAGFAAVGSAAITAAPLIGSAVTALVEVGAAAIAAAPALLAMGAAGLIVKASLAKIFAEGSAARRALEPLGAMMTKAGEAGSRAAAKGIRPLAEALRRVAQPTVTRYMEGVGLAANRVQKDFLRWGASADGLKTLRNILEPISAAAQRLAPHVSRVGIEFARMLGRIMPLSTAVGSKGLAGALDWLAEKLRGINAETVAGGMSKLMTTAVTVGNVIRTLAGWIGTLVDAYKLYTREFGMVADALSVVAIVFGGPVTAAIAAAGLIIRHFDEVKAGWERLKTAFSGGGTGGPLAKALHDVKTAAMTVLPALKTAFQQIKAAVWPVLRDIGAMIKDDLIPTFGEFLKAIAPFVAWLTGVLSPVVAQVFGFVASFIKASLNILSGVLKIFIGIFTGDWRKAWQGVQQIAKAFGDLLLATFKLLISALKAIWQMHLAYLRPLWNSIKGIFTRGASAAISGVVNAFRGGLGKVRGALSAVKNSITGVFRGAGSWLWNAGRAIIDGLIRGIQSALGWLRNQLRSVTNMIPDWKGPMRVDLKLLEPTGAAIMRGLTSGITGALPDVRDALQGVTGSIPDYAAPAGVRRAGRSGGAGGELVIRSGGTKLDDLLVEVLRRAVSGRGGDVQKVLGPRR